MWMKPRTILEAAFLDARVRFACPGKELCHGLQSHSEAIGAELLVEEFLGPRHVVFRKMLDDDRDVGVLLRQALEIEIVVQRAEATGAGSSISPTPRKVMAFQRIGVADVGVLFRLVAARALDVLGVRDL